MDPIIPAVDPNLLEEELNEHNFIRNTNNGKNKIYIFSANEAPHLMRELGRLREITFRDAGGGTGKGMDIDEFDTADPPFHQLIVWNPAYKEIVGGYRFIHGKDIPCNTEGCLHSATAELFHCNKKFIDEDGDGMDDSVAKRRGFNSSHDRFVDSDNDGICDGRRIGRSEKQDGHGTMMNRARHRKGQQ